MGLTRLLRQCLSEKDDRYVFERFDQKADPITFPSEGGLYLHIPFCKSLCPFCPYYKVFYDSGLARRFHSAVLAEIEMASRLLKEVRWSSLYIGGGTPTLMMDELPDIIHAIKTQFYFHGPICLETTPKELTEEKIAQLEDLGVDLLSVGVQTFQDQYLKAIGRDYLREDILRALRSLQGRSFSTINYDLIFILPGQDLAGLKADLDQACEFLPQQITVYPLFTFPYAAVGKFKRLKRLKLPPVFLRKKMYYFLHEYLERKGYQRTSVWTFNRKGTLPYSSVTRDFYLGLGPGAGTYTGKRFFFNTFSVSEYNRVLLEERQLPVALNMDVTPRMAKLFWLYWRLYETEIPLEYMNEFFKFDLRQDFAFVLKAFSLLGWIDRADERGVRLNKKGVHWVHLMQNYFALNYVSRIWQACQDNPWPEQVVI